MRNRPSIQAEYLIYLLALLKFIIPFLIQNSSYEPHRDEFLYLAEARHMAFGYPEVPPMMSVFAYLTNHMGGSLFWIRIWPSLFGSLTYLLVGRLILVLGGKWFALILGFLPFIFGYFMHVHFIFQPNFLEVFFWTLIAFGLIRYVQNQNPAGLYIAGVALGLGLMSKYSVIFFAVSLLLGLLLSSERKILLDRHFYYSLLIGFLIFLPNLIWQYAYGFPIIHHMKELENEQLQNMSQFDFLTGQLSYNLPTIFIWFSGLCWIGFSKAGKQFRFIGWAVLFVMIILLAGHGKAYYGMGAYPVLFGFGAVCLERWTEQRFIYLRYVMVIISISLGCFINTITLPFLPPQKLADFYSKNNIIRKMGFLRWEDQKDHLLPQDFADMLSWREITEKTAKVYNSLDSSEKSQTILDGDNYGEAGALDYYGPQINLPHPIADMASFLLWVPPDFYKSNIVILITDYREIMDSKFIQGFKTATLMDSVTNNYAREFGTYIVLLKGPSEKFRQDWRNHFESRRKEMSFFQ